MKLKDYRDEILLSTFIFTVIVTCFLIVFKWSQESAYQHRFDSRIEHLRQFVEKTTEDRWTAKDHDRYAKVLNSRLRLQEERLNRVLDSLKDVRKEIEKIKADMKR